MVIVMMFSVDKPLQLAQVILIFIAHPFFEYFRTVYVGTLLLDDGVELDKEIVLFLLQITLIVLYM